MSTHALALESSLSVFVARWTGQMEDRLPEDCAILTARSGCYSFRNSMLRTAWSKYFGRVGYFRFRIGVSPGGWLWDRFTVHYTPKHGSWLNQAEIEIGIFSRQCLGKRRIGNISTLRRQAKAWNRRTNRDKITIQWKFTRKLARMKLNYSITRSRY